MSLQTKIKNFIRKQNLIQEGEKLLVAYSGGPDSTALLIVLTRLYKNVAAVYVNHQLRGSESAEEETFVQEFCASRKIPLFMERIHWEKKPSNLEHAARKRRYRHLSKVARAEGFHKIALGHHKNDVAETFLLNLFRGSGPAGLAGLRAQRDIYVRPLLECTRHEILEFLKREQIPFFQDTSNTNFDWKRNRVRSELIPYMEKHFNPAVTHAICRTANWISEQNHLLLNLLQPYMSLLKQAGTWQLERTSWSKLTPELQKAILRTLLPEISPDLRLDARTLDALLKSIDKGQSMELPGFMKVQPSADYVEFIPKEKRVGVFEVDVTGPGSYIFPPSKAVLDFSVISSTQFQPSRNVAYLDAKRATFPFYIRNWKRGDSFRPLGMKGHKKLSDFWIDQRVPKESRKLIPLVFKDDDLVWLAGYQIHHDYRVTEGTKKILRIEIKENV